MWQCHSIYLSPQVAVYRLTSCKTVINIYSDHHQMLNHWSRLKKQQIYFLLLLLLLLGVSDMICKSQMSDLEQNHFQMTEKTFFRINSSSGSSNMQDLTSTFTSTNYIVNITIWEMGRNHHDKSWRKQYGPTFLYVHILCLCLQLQTWFLMWLDGTSNKQTINYMSVPPT